VSLARQPSSDEGDECSWIGGQGRELDFGRDEERDRNALDGVPKSLRSYGKVTFERDLDLRPSELVALVEPRRRCEEIDERGECVDSAGVEEPEEGGRATIEKSMLYAGVDGSDVRSATTGDETEE
jgi:hypothetical protein